MKNYSTQYALNFTSSAARIRTKGGSEEKPPNFLRVGSYSKPRVSKAQPSIRRAVRILPAEQKFDTPQILSYCNKRFVCNAPKDADQMPAYTDISSKEWKKLLDTDYPPNVRASLAKIHSYGRKAIVPAGEVLSWFSAINQVNQAFIKKKMRFRLRIVQGGYPRNPSYPDGYLVQLVKKLPDK